MRIEISKVSYDLVLKGRMVHWGTAVVKRAINFLMECSTKLVLAGEMRKGNDRGGALFYTEELPI